MVSARQLALRALVRWRTGKGFADQVIKQLLSSTSLDEADRGFTLELFYGALRNFTLLDFWIGKLRSTELDPRTRDLLRLGLYQLFLLQIPPHAAVFETVALAPQRTRPLINAILRRALREQARLTKASDAEPSAVRYSIPEFLIQKWTRQFGNEATIALCQWNNSPAPNYARINQLRITAQEFLDRHPGSFSLPGRPNFVGLTNPATATRTGDGYIQDPSTAIACEMLRPHPGERVLDACAAPGGKTAYLAEMMSNEGELVAADFDASRLQRLRDNLRRLGVTNAKLVHCNWLDETSIRSTGFRKHSFDRILLDAPCTNTGVMRRRVDVRWRLRPDDFARMPRQQFGILSAVRRLLKPEGSLVYSTCSLEPEENEEVVESFLRAHPNFCLTTRAASLPFRDHFDGAFAARLHQDTPME